MTELVTKWLPSRDSLYPFVASCVALLSLAAEALHTRAARLLAAVLNAYGMPSRWCSVVEAWLAAHAGAVAMVAAVIMAVGWAGMDGFDREITRASSTWLAASAVLVETGYWWWWAALGCLLVRALLASTRARDQGSYVVLCAVLAMVSAPSALWAYLTGPLHPDRAGGDGRTPNASPPSGAAIVHDPVRVAR